MDGKLINQEIEEMSPLKRDSKFENPVDGRFGHLRPVPYRLNLPRVSTTAAVPIHPLPPVVTHETLLTIVRRPSQKLKFQQSVPSEQNLILAGLWRD